MICPRSRCLCTRELPCCCHHWASVLPPSRLTFPIMRPSDMPWSGLCIPEHHQRCRTPSSRSRGGRRDSCLEDAIARLLSAAGAAGCELQSRFPQDGCRFRCLDRPIANFGRRGPRLARLRPKSAVGRRASIGAGRPQFFEIGLADEQKREHALQEQVCSHSLCFCKSRTRTVLTKIGPLVGQTPASLRVYSEKLGKRHRTFASALREDDMHRLKPLFSADLGPGSHVPAARQGAYLSRVCLPLVLWALRGTPPLT